MDVIEIKKLKKSFHKQNIFDDFSLSVAEHEFLIITGASGSGKSTLLNLIGLLEEKDEGDIYLYSERNVKPFSTKAQHILHDKIGYLFQNFTLLEEKTVAYNLKLALVSRKEKTGWKDKVKAVLEEVGLSGCEDKLICECSGGEQQRIALARLLLKPCSLLLADEPTGSLDEENKQIVMNLLEKLHKEGKTIVMVTHDKEVLSYATRHVHID